MGRWGPYIVTAQDSYDLAAAIQLDEQSFVEVLHEALVSRSLRTQSAGIDHVPSLVQAAQEPS